MVSRCDLSDLNLFHVVGLCMIKRMQMMQERVFVTKVVTNNQDHENCDWYLDNYRQIGPVVPCIWSSRSLKRNLEASQAEL